MSGESQALLEDSRISERSLSGQAQHEESFNVEAIRGQTRRFLASKYGHYLVLLLVSLDVSCIFADFLTGFYICEHTCKGETVNKSFPMAQDALGVVSLVFSCMFIVELLASIWAFGLR